MKVLLTGATGTIGGGALRACLAHPQITTVVAFVRRALPEDLSSNPKLETVIVKDFSIWPDELLDRHMDAAAMIWALGSLSPTQKVDVEYPLAFQEAFIKRRSLQETPAGFRYVHVSGKFVEQDPDRKLYFLDAQRKTKGLHDTKAVALADQTDSWWKLTIVRPGGVLADGFATGVLAAIMGKNWAINVGTLGAYIAYVAVGGEVDATIVLNGTIVEKGRELLKGVS
ncbi:uncharacterized protein N7496_003553 [Penicillium cataractarum]|uniref:NAD(P)-binding domain-containing protein n=1 Tax=Penicillium cataractarum TaxID=2100454 RepID=A0A9W9SMG9_9EURO|nr:uncharacterized protein N7496_003553 [Penicillium cataractarum]KAJ5381125.1 hypothetical protein N7496_003553 [Penicillium cataractarum]